MEKQLNETVTEPVQPGSVSAEQQDSALAKSMERTANVIKPKVFMIGVGLAIVLGLGTGYIVAAITKPAEVLPLASTTDNKTGTTATTTIKVGQVFGSKDASAFKDSAEGIILAGGIGNEGSHHLVRAGGASQNVYLTSSVLDLKMFENTKVKIYGETFKGKKAGWLMDVGRAEVIELNAPLPDWVVKEQQKTAAPVGD